MLKAQTSRTFLIYSLLCQMSQKPGAVSYLYVNSGLISFLDKKKNRYAALEFLTFDKEALYLTQISRRVT